VIVLDLGYPAADPLSVNEERSLCWQAIRRRTRPWRDMTWALALQAKLARRIDGRACTITVIIPFDEDRQRDPANFYPTVKAIVDGLVMARCWPADTPEYVTVTEPVLRIGGHAAVHLVVREEQAA
jgi:crossover junction endodeoxyribonuclease RusA